VNVQFTNSRLALLDRTEVSQATKWLLVSTHRDAIALTIEPIKYLLIIEILGDNSFQSFVKTEDIGYDDVCFVGIVTITLYSLLATNCRTTI
jgi:hypothetical protein